MVIYELVDDLKYARIDLLLTKLFYFNKILRNVSPFHTRLTDCILITFKVEDPNFVYFLYLLFETIKGFKKDHNKTPIKLVFIQIKTHPIVFVDNIFSNFPPKQVFSFPPKILPKQVILRYSS